MKAPSELHFPTTFIQTRTAVMSHIYYIHKTRAAQLSKSNLTTNVDTVESLLTDFPNYNKDKIIWSSQNIVCVLIAL